MPERLGFKPSEMGGGWYIRAECKTCRESRYLGRQMMIDRAGDVPLRLIEPRLRCVARPWSNKRGPACGGRMEMHPCAPSWTNEYHPDYRPEAALPYVGQ